MLSLSLSAQRPGPRKWDRISQDISTSRVISFSLFAPLSIPYPPLSTAIKDRGDFFLEGNVNFPTFGECDRNLARDKYSH